MGQTLFEPPPYDFSKSQMENILELTPVADIGQDVFTNTRPLWHPPGARGVYGGAVIAQSLAAAQKTVAKDFYPHSMHCYFVLAGDSELPVLYHVERVRDGRSFATRTVQARQRGRPIFTTTMSFDREMSSVEEEKKKKGKQMLQHQQMKPQVTFPSTALDDDKFARLLGNAPIQAIRDVKAPEPTPKRPSERPVYHYVRSRPKLVGGPEAHLSAFAYLSDSYFVGTVAHVHDLPRFASVGALTSMLSQLKNPSDLEPEALATYIRKIEEAERRKREKQDREDQERDPREIGMMVSLDHTIYFHTRRGFRADDWMLVEMHSPWAGEERGLVLQKVWTKDGTLIATCVQEGIIRLKKDPEAKL